MPETTLEERIAGLEGAYKELSKRIDDLRSEMHRGFDLLRAEMQSGDANLRSEMGSMNANLRAEISDLKRELRSSFRWTMSLVLINWLSVLAAIFLVAARK
jgi:predicted  nucleic acid-binding Zn-ribbon protein